MVNLSIGDAAKYIGVSRDTLRRWEKKGKISPQRSPTNRRYYTKDQLDALLNKKKAPSPSPVKITPAPSPSSANLGNPSGDPLRLVVYSLLTVFVTFLVGLILIMFSV